MDMDSVLIVNSGSSSLKASLFSGESRLDFKYDHLSDLGQAFAKLASDLEDLRPDCIGHRFVHGGDINEPARIVDESERERLESLIPLAPLHLPGNLM